jgi:D-aminopeptidase
MRNAVAWILAWSISIACVAQDGAELIVAHRIAIGELPPGPLNAITDVAGVGVGHATLRRGEDVRTGVTIIVPRMGENLWAKKVPAAVVTGNGYGKAAGFTQVEELGELEAPIGLTNTLSVGAVLDALVRLCLDQPGCEDLRSINVVVGETNDGRLNDIRGQHVQAEHVLEAWRSVSGGPVPEGAVGAGTGTVCFGYKGGIGTSSRLAGAEPWTVGVLVQTNFGGRLRVDGQPFPAPGRESGDGSCMIVVATDAPLDARNLRRLAKRALFGLARCGSSMSNGSGDYVIAFSTCPENAIEANRREPFTFTLLPNAAMTALFEAVIEATEEAVLHSLLAAETTTGRGGLTVPAIDPEAVERALER